MHTQTHIVFPHSPSPTTTKTTIVSGQPPEEPVVSKTGHIFERRLIEKHISTEGNCPITKEPLSVEDLVSLKGEKMKKLECFSKGKKIIFSKHGLCQHLNTYFTVVTTINQSIKIIYNDYHIFLFFLAESKIVKPRPTAATSIPGLLAIFQNEWDSLMLETFTLKQHLDTVSFNLFLHSFLNHHDYCWWWMIYFRLMKGSTRVVSCFVSTRCIVSSDCKIDSRKRSSTTVSFCCCHNLFIAYFMFFFLKLIGIIFVILIIW